MRSMRKIAVPMLAVTFALYLGACEQREETPAEQMGDAAEDAGEAIEDAGDEMKDAVD